MNTSQVPVTIDDQLRFVLFGIQSVLGAWFPGKVIEQIFADAKDDMVSEKSYVLCDGPAIKVVGKVDEYEPETLWMTVTSRRLPQTLLDQIVENAEFEIYRVRKS